MFSYTQAIIMGALQGITELFPISSLGHSIILPSLIGWHIDQEDNFFIVFLVATHLATALVLLGFYWKEWVKIIGGVLKSLKTQRVSTEDTYAKIGWLVIVGTIPAGILGLLFKHKLEHLFASPEIVSIFLILNGVMLYGFELLRRKKSTINVKSDTEIAALSFGKAIKVGFAQCLALLPGFSRTGSTMGGSLLVGLEHENAIHFSFLLATPIITAAAVLKLPDLIGSSSDVHGPIIVGSISSAIFAYLSVRFLTRYFETKTLTPFAWYCAIAGAISYIVFLVK